MHVPRVDYNAVSFLPVAEHRTCDTKNGIGMGFAANFAAVFENLFSNPERRSALAVTLIVAVVIVVILMFDMSRLNTLFYKPDQSLLYNVVNFFSVMSVCFLFGFIFSRLQLWVRSGSFLKKRTGGSAGRKSVKSK
jgi:hypothetical protein